MRRLAGCDVTCRADLLVAEARGELERGLGLLAWLLTRALLALLDALGPGDEVRVDARKLEQNLCARDPV